ncbi:helix-turn-helix domain-containing protein [Streptomyces sp. Babs14]|uniref:transcriptional regulator n=1 Tax=unclassified Streptomyces TaxID=2593676 RepID=UPI001C2424F2|nr:MULTISPECIES: transcriptional regulator [unclassified Streptomyces]MBU8553809.1 helix-turn-helix domain-containing protein [Streptomyces sp. Osf17]MBU8560602.1 helix-turn-helix domain-containing protein [Streptomyces sp. Babs14]
MGCLGYRPGAGRVVRGRTGALVPAQKDGDGTDEVAEFAEQLRSLKERTDRSYGSLARRLGMNTSTLHRYCAGDTVPLDFAAVERFAALCGATSEQRLQLHRRWLLAVAARQRPRTRGSTQATPGIDAAGPADDTAAAPDKAVRDVPRPDTTPKAHCGPVTSHTDPKATGAPVYGTAPADETPDTPVPPSPPCPRYRRRRLAAGLASVCAVAATLGALAAQPDERRVTADRPARNTSPAATGTAQAGAPERPAASPSPHTPPTSEGPSASATPRTTPDVSRPPGGTSAPIRDERPAVPPLTWTVDSQAWELGCGHDYVIVKPPSQVPPPPAPQDAAPWAATQSAVHGGKTLVRLSTQGLSDTAVVLEALRVRVVGRTAPAEGNAYAMDQGCGGSITPRHFAVDLDKDRPIARAVAGNDAGSPIPAVRMPYRVSAKDPEVLLVAAETGSCDCRWYLELDWSSQGRQGTVRIDDHGRPFRTSAIEGLPRYTYNTLGRRWEPYG